MISYISSVASSAATSRSCTLKSLAIPSSGHSQGNIPLSFRAKNPTFTTRMAAKSSWISAGFIRLTLSVLAQWILNILKMLSRWLFPSFEVLFCSQDQRCVWRLVWECIHNRPEQAVALEQWLLQARQNQRKHYNPVRGLRSEWSESHNWFNWKWRLGLKDFRCLLRALRFLD